MTDAYDAGHPGAAQPAPTDQGEIKSYKPSTALDNIKFGTKYLAGKALHGIVDLTVSPVNYLNNKLGFSSDAETARISKEINAGKGIDLGIQNEVYKSGTDNKALNVAGDLLHMAPAIVGAESSGGASFYLQGMGAAANQVADMKANGVKFNHHSDDLYINGAGLINYILGKSVSSTILNKMGTGFTNDVVGSLSADATKELADLGANATVEDIANHYVTKALNFSQRLQQLGLGVVKTYPKIGTDFAGANLATSALKAGVNELSGNKPLGDVTGDELVKDVSSPFYNNDTPANGKLGQFVLNMINTPAAGLSALHGAMSVGMLFDKSPVKNAVIESLQKDGSPKNVEAVKAQIEDMGLKKGWTDDEIANTKTTVDALADITSKIPADLAPGKFYDATNLILGRRQLEAVLKETQSRKEGLDPALAGKTAAFESLLNAKIEQANDKLDEIVTDKKFTYTNDNGKYYKSKDGEEPVEITKDRFDLEEVENKSRPAAEKTKIITEAPGGARSETKKEPVTEPAKTSPQDIPQEKAKPVTDTSMLDDLDSELDSFKQAKTGIESTESDTKPPESVTKQTENVSEPKKEEPTDAIQKQTANEVRVRDTPAMGKEVGSGDTGPEKPAATGSEVQTDEAHQSRSATEGNGLADDYDTSVVKQSYFKNVAKRANPDIDLNKVREESIAIAKERGADMPSFGDFEKATHRVIDQNENIPAKPTAPVPAEKPEPAKPEKVTAPVNAEPADTQVEMPYYVNLPEGPKETSGKPVPNDHGLDLFSHNLEDIGGKGFGVSEGSTGLSMATGGTEQEAIDNAKDLLSKKSPAEMQAIIKKKHESGTTTPRGIVGKGSETPVESTDTENTEAVIAKATAVAGKAADITGKSDKSAGIVNEIDDALADIDKEIEDLKAKGVDIGRYTIPKDEPAVNGHGLKAGDKVVYGGRKITVDNLSKEGVNFRSEYNGLIVQSTTHEKVKNDLETGKLKMDTGEPEPEAAKEEPQQDAKSEKRKKYEDELKAAKKAFMDTFNKALSGINPESLEKGIKLIAVYAKIGIHDFKEIAADLAADLGEKLRDIFEGLKASYGAYAYQEASEAELSKMTSLLQVRKATIDDFLKNTKDDTGSESDTLAKNSPELDAGEPAGGPAANVESRNTEAVHGSEDDRGGKTGDAVKKQNDTGRGTQPGGGDDTGTGAGRAAGRPAQPDNGPANEPNAPKRKIAPEDQNHVIKPDDTIVPQGAVGKFNANVDAIFLLKKLEAEDRNPTPEEKKALAQFVGWGGLAKYLNTPNRYDNEAVRTLLDGSRNQFYDSRYNRVTLDFTDRGPLDLKKYASFNDLLSDARKILANSGYAISPDDLRAPLLKAMLSNEEYQAAQNSTINAHYTERAVINNMWDLTDKLGFKGGRVLESSAGIGHFFGLMPKEYQGKTSLQGYELDSITGRMLKKLYPQANITVSGFEHSRVPQNTQDLVIGNVPFAASAPYDKSFPDLSKFSMHNYFIAKNLKLLKPGGLAVMITSSSTMDNPASAKFREWVTAPDGGNSYLVGAMRFPNNAFDENAGTQVTTDMLVFQKKGQVVNTDLEQPFRYTNVLKTGKDADGNDVDIHVNEYYHAHPEQMMGEMMTAHEAGSGGLYGSDNATLKAPAGFNINKELKKANDIFPSDIAGNKTEPEKVQEQPITAMDEKEGSLFTRDGKIYRVADGDGVQVPLDTKQQAIAKHYIDVKSGLLNLISLEQKLNNPEANIEAQRKELNKDYDAFVKKYGNINGRTTDFLNDVDIDFAIVASLENISRSIESKGGKDRIVATITKGDILTKRINFPRQDPTTATDIKDAINISLNYRNGLDINYMAKMLGEDPDEIRQRMLDEELAYDNPDTGILETPEEYLSGYVRDKLKKAEIASVNDPVYLKNVAQLKKIIPEDIPASLISYSLGSSWIPPHVYEEFAKHLFEANIGVKYLDLAGKFVVTKGWNRNNAQVMNTYAAGGQDGIDLLDATLNNRQVVVYDTVVGADGSKKKVKNPEKTAAAQAMQTTLQEQFEEYVRTNEAVQQETERIYNDVFNGQVLRTYRIPDFKHYPGASTTITLREHQKRAVSRNLVECTLDAHEVGSGKAQPYDAKILTPFGWKLMGDIKAGDQVISVDGRPTEVTAVYPQGEKEIFKVTFSDGSSTECCDEHLWLTQTYKERTSMINEKRFNRDWPSCKPKIRALSEIRKTLNGRLIGNNEAKNHSIPITQPVQFNSQPLIVHPYLMGVILGDGCVRTKGVSFTSIEEEIIDKVEAVLPDGFTLTKKTGKKRQSYHICKPKGKYSSIVQDFKREGVMGMLSFEKSIPEKYLFNTIECRLEILRGLLDTDGTVSKKSGSTIYYTTSDQLSKDVKFLVETLGGIASVSTKIPSYTHLGENKKGRICYILHIKLPNCFNPFSLTRKSELVKEKGRYKAVRYIVSVESVGFKEAQCIAVDHPSHLYLTDDCIVTHNTYTIITTAMEMRRLGTARKPLIGVQNSTLSDFVADFKRLYPSAKILAPSQKEMEADGRRKLFGKIATGDWDAIILPHSQVTMIPDDPERQKAYIMEQVEEMRQTIASLDDYNSKKKLEYEVKQLLKEMDKLEPSEDDGKKTAGKSVAKKIGAKSLKIQAGMEKALDRKVDNVMNFEQLGIDAMLMDEAHKYKRLGFQTSMQNIKGIDTAKSQRSQSVLLKSRWIQEKTGGKNVSFFTGTPISNTMAEAWTMMKYLRPDILQHMGIEYFDQFAKTFGQVVPSLEQTGGGTFKVQSRFAKFQNLPEFITAFRAMTDVVLTQDVKEFQNTDTIPKLKNGKFTQVILPQSNELKVQINEFKRTLEWFDKLTGKEKKENSHVPLVVFTKAKQASIDLRLLDPTNVDSPMSKVNHAVENAYRIYKDNADKKGVQMIFSDMYQSPEPKNKYLDEDGYVVNPAYGKDRFNLFEDIKKKLVAKGVPADQIVIFTEPKYDKAERKKAVFGDANSGKIRFLLGTTEKMGVGVNAQQKLVALHHLDAPARPMDFEQRNGRIIRQGNENKEVEVLTYGVEKTLDSSAFQRLSTKQKFINQIMKGENLERVTEDPADESQMTFDEMMAHLSDSPFALQKLLVDNKLRSEQMKQQNFQQKIIRSNRILRDTEGDLKRDRAKLVDQIKYAEIVREKIPDGNITSIVIHGQPEITEKFSEGADAYVQKLIDKYFNSPTKYAKGGFDLNGMRVELEIVNKEKTSKETGLVVDTPMLTYTMPDVGLVGESWSSGGYEIPSNSGTGLLSSIRSKLDGTLVKPSGTQAQINNDEKNIEVLRKDTKATFDTTKMKELEAESEALKAKMLAETKKTPPEDDNNPGGGQTTGEYIRDQSNIKGALDFLDKMKAQDGGKFLSSIIPIPPAVWNGAIDVMKNILKATNSTQKAIRVASQYIVDRGGSEAQAKDFEATIGDKMAKSEIGKRATVADTEDATSAEILQRAAVDLQTKMKGQELSPDEKTFAALDVSKLNAKELHRYIEVAAVLSVDPQGVLSKEVGDLLDRVGNRLNPKGGTAVPPAPPATPPGNNGNLMDDDEPRRRIPKKDKLPMETTDNLPEQTGEDGKPVAKENYSAIGRFKDIRVRNLEQLKQYGKDLGDLSALRDVRQYATSKSQASIVMKTATDRILRAVGKPGWDLLREALVESRLRGIRQRWDNWAEQIKKTSDNELDDLFEDGKQSMMYDIVSRLDGYEDDPKPEQTILGMISNDQYDDAREYLSDMFSNAADNVAFFDKLSNGKTFDEIVKDQQFVDPKMQEAFQAYKSLMAKPFEDSHAANEGIFSDALGPLDTYYPLVPTGADKHYVVTPGNKYKAPENPNNKFATGQGQQYSTALADLSHRLANAIRTSNKANAIRSLENAGLIAKVNKDTPEDGFINVNGEIYTAKKVMVQDSRLVTANGRTSTIPARYVLMPNWLYKEVTPIFEDSGNLHDDFSLFGRINNIGIKLMLGGPIEATSHSYRLLGGIVNSMPYMQEWAYKNGILGHAGGLVLNNPFVKTFAGMGHILFTDISSDEALAIIQEMAKLGIIPEKTWQKTWSKEFAELTGAKKVPLWDWSPILYGKNSVDLKARVMLYRLSKAMNPDATPEQLVKMQNELGNYTIALQGELEKFVKRHGLAPFYSFGGAIYRSGIKSVFGLSPLPLTRPSLKEAFTTKLGAEQMAKLATYGMAKLITAGIIGLVGYWAFIYHAQTNRWPWESSSSKLLKLPYPAWAKNDLTRKMFMDKKSGAYPDVDFSFFNPFINRGIRAVGAPKAYETHMLGGTAGQSIEAGSIQAINTNLSPYTSSPSIQLGVTALTGDAPYITGIRDKYAGTPGIGFFRKVNTFPAGAQIPANLAVGVAGINPIVDYALSPLTKSLKYKYAEGDQDVYSAATSVFNTIIPHLMSPHGSDEFKAMGIKKQQKAIHTSMTKEQAKLHKK